MTSTPIPSSICLLRLSALGDVCNSIPIIRALQRTYPHASISWIIGPLEYKLVSDLPGVEFIVFDKRRGWAAIRQLRRRLAKRHFDVLLHAQVSTRANVLASMVPATRRVGFDQARAREGHSLVVRERIPVAEFQHQAQALWSFAEHLAAKTDEADRAPPIPDLARCFAERHQPEPGRAVLISPASSHSGRNWHAAGYAEVIDWIVHEARRKVVLIGGPSTKEKELAEAILRNSRAPVTNLVGQDTLKQGLAMIERAACIITPDSGPAHFAASLGTPVVGLYAATWSRRSGPLGSLEHCVDRFPEATWRFAGKPPEKMRWGQRLEKPGVMDLIKSSMVIEKLAPLLTAELQVQSAV